jgi:hypothetical protein
MTASNRVPLSSDSTIFFIASSILANSISLTILPGKETQRLFRMPSNLGIRRWVDRIGGKKMSALKPYHNNKNYTLNRSSGKAERGLAKKKRWQAKRKFYGYNISIGFKI